MQWQPGGPGSDEELDRLADYAAGLLDGTPAGTEVHRLVSTDPGWAAALAALTEADPRVCADLSDLAATVPILPGDIAARLDTALSAVSGPDRTISADSEVRELAARAESRTPGRTRLPADRSRQRWRRRWAMVGAAAAAVAAVAAFGLPVLLNSGPAGLVTSGDRAEAPAGGEALRENQSLPPVAPEAPGLVLTASGQDYRPGGSQAAPGAADMTAGSTARDSAAQPGNAPGPGIAPELSRLLDPAARQACLGAVAAGQPDRPVRIDYARFMGIPALLIFFAPAQSGTATRAVVVGAACGLPGSGGDVRYTGPVR
jgi:hypothetical protein